MFKTVHFLVMLSSMVLVGCAANDKSVVHTQFAPTSSDAKIQIVTSFYPLTFLSKAVVGDYAQVIDLAGAREVHEYTLSPEDIKNLYKADLVLYMGSGLENWTEDIIPQLNVKGVKTIDITDGMELFINPNDVNASRDPHVWLDPVYAQEITQRILSAVKSVDIGHADVYVENAQQVMNELHMIDQEYVDGLRKCEQHQGIVSHEAFGYIARRYGLELHSIVGLSTMDEPSVQFLAKLKEFAQNEGITRVLVEKNSVQRFAQTTNLDILPIYSLEREDFETHDTYYDMMRNNLQSLQIAFACQ